MRYGPILAGMLTVCGMAHAQAPAPVVPISQLETTLAEVRTQASAIAELLTADRLEDPILLHDIAALLDATALTVHTMATHAEHGQITATQRALLQAQVEKLRLQLESMNELLRNRQLR
jgi:hypothetical protein